MFILVKRAMSRLAMVTQLGINLIKKICFSRDLFTDIHKDTFTLEKTISSIRENNKHFGLFRYLL